MTVFDPGLQPERTELAWRRTALTVGVGSLVSLRLLPAALGDPAWAFVGVAGVLAATASWVSARRRAQAAITALLRDGDRGLLPGGFLLAALAGFVQIVGATALVVVVLVHRMVNS